MIFSLHCSNISFMQSTFFNLVVLKLAILRNVKDLHFLNILLISVTLSVSKLDKSNDFKDLQPVNTPFILVAPFVLKFEKCIFSNLLQPLNIFDMSFILLLLNLEKSKEIKVSHL